MSAQHLPPEALDEWLAAAAAELGLDPNEIDIATVLDVARDVSRSVARPAAPLTTFLVGLAMGRATRADGTVDAARDALASNAKAATELAFAWQEEHSTPEV